MTTLEPRQAIQAFIDETITGTELARALVSWPNWNVPAQLDQSGTPGVSRFVTPNGERFFRLFSDGGAIDELRAAEGDDAVGPHFVETSGWWAFGQLTDDLQWVDINPKCKADIHYRQPQFEMLREMARAVRIEGILGDMAHAQSEDELAHAGGADDPMAAVREYEGYRIVLQESGEDDFQLVLAPDTKNRLLAAVFTAADTLQAFLNDRTELLDGNHRSVTVDGKTLFAQLKQIELQGLVFNCSGPIRPAALASQFLDLVLP
ncbi:MAG: hypothetical protein KC609_24765 [Myxococcales bacterium]|nr:hypothetical protein [Myxococcales bacterium]